MTSRIEQNYTVLQSGGDYTITYAGGHPSESFSAVVAEFILHSDPNFFYVGTPYTKTLLDARKCTNPVAANRAALISAIQALYSPSVFDGSISIDPALTTNQLVLEIGGNVVNNSWPAPNVIDSPITLTYPNKTSSIVGDEGKLSVDFNFTGASTAACRVNLRKRGNIIDGVVFGIAGTNSSGAAATLNAASGTIPVGYRPGETRWIPIQGLPAVFSGNAGCCRFNADGSFTIGGGAAFLGNPANFANGAAFSFNAFSFSYSTDSF